MEKDLFLCHSSVDKAWVKELGQDIEAEDWKGRSLAVFLDEWDIEGGENILLKLDAALKDSRFVAVVMSPEMLTSDWCRGEWTSILHDDPTNRRGRLLPIRLRDRHLTTGEPIEVPAFLRTLKYFDFREQRNHRASFASLLAKLRGEAPPRVSARGGARRITHDERIVPALPSSRHEPDQVQETLLSNLLPVRVFPAAVWSAPTTVTSKYEFSDEYPACVVREGRLYTFASLAIAGNPFEAWIDRQRIRHEPSVEWRADTNKWRWYVELLNDTLRAHLRRAGVEFDPLHKRYFFAAQDLHHGARRLKWGAGTRRWVVRQPDAGTKGYWVHHAATLGFETLGERLYLSIEPTVVFTVDGKKPVDREVAGPLSMRWTGKERNGAVLRHVLMWSDALAQGKREAAVEAGDQQLILGRLPTTAQVTVGIAHDRVAVGALLEFTRVELDPKAARPHLFGFVGEPGATEEEGP